MNTYFSHLYYIKKFSNSKYLKILNYYHGNFLNKFMNGLPKYLDATDRKNSKKNIITKEEAIFKNFIFYNSKVIKFLIIDIDNRNEFGNKFELLEYLKDFNLTPSWILDTNKGYHVGYILKNAIPYENNKAKDFAKNTLKKLSLLLGGDKNALRLRGRFRNPFKHDTFYTDLEYDLIDIIDNIPEFIADDVEINHNNNKKVHKNIFELKELILKVLNNINYIKNVEIGFRNSFLWYLGMIIAKEYQYLPDKRKYLHIVEEKINFYNNNLKEPLDEKEIENIIKSIYKYFTKRKIMVGLGMYKDWTKEMKNLYMKRYLKERGKIKHSNEERKEINKNKVLQSIYKLRKEGKKVSIRKIAEVANLNKNTVNKYVKELKENPKFAVLFDK